MKLALLLCLLASWVFPAWSQDCTSTQSCSANCRSNADQGRCCALVLPNNPTPDNNPLDYLNYFISGTDQDLPNSCVNVKFTTDELSSGNVYYVIVAVETQNTRLCLRSNMNNNPICGSGAIYFCRMVPVTPASPTVNINLFCDNSCEVTESSFWIKADKIVLENDDEFLCDNNATQAVYPLPSSLNQAVGATQAQRTFAPTSSAHPLPISQTTILLALLAFMLKQFLL